jgi:hypothetical protein
MFFNSYPQILVDILRHSAIEEVGDVLVVLIKRILMHVTSIEVTRLFSSLQPIWSSDAFVIMSSHVNGLLIDSFQQYLIVYKPIKDRM